LNLVIALALGLGVDYALLIVTRWREVRYDAGSAADASRRTLRLVAPTVVSSALSVAAAMGALLAFPMLFLRSMAIGGIVCALLAGVMALVFVPAALALLGDRLDAGVPQRLRIAPGTVGGSRVWGMLAHVVMRRPLVVALATSALLLAIAAPALHIKFGGVDATAVTPGTEIRNVDDALRTQFTGITVAGMRVVVRTDAQGAVAPPTLAAIERVAAASGIALPLQVPQPAGEGLALVEVPVTGDPQRAAANRLLAQLRGIDRADVVGVTGETARIHDALASLRQHAPWAVLVAGLTTLVFVFLFTGSVLLPIKTVVMNALGACAAFGVLVFVFQEGRFEGLLDYSSPGSIESSQPILLAAVAFGLATDYGLILLGRIREERLRYGVTEREAIATGLTRTGRMVSSAALLLSIALGAFATSDVVFIKELGVGIVVAVVLDATVVRGLLVPSLMALFGKWNWWAPAPLRRFHERFGLRD
ncbi:MAG: family transporter, partial [Thermoleophilia bacterium]|nr:family transporter [Thermoleophilia bacterium]